MTLLHLVHVIRAVKGHRLQKPPRRLTTPTTNQYLYRSISNLQNWETEIALEEKSGAHYYWREPAQPKQLYIQEHEYTLWQRGTFVCQAGIRMHKHTRDDYAVESECATVIQSKQECWSCWKEQ